MNKKHLDRLLVKRQQSFCLSDPFWSLGLHCSTYTRSCDVSLMLKPKTNPCLSCGVGQFHSFNIPLRNPLFVLDLYALVHCNPGQGRKGGMHTGNHLFWKQVSCNVNRIRVSAGFSFENEGTGNTSFHYKDHCVIDSKMSK